MNHNFKKAMTALMLSALIVSSFSAVTAGANDAAGRLIHRESASASQDEELGGSSSSSDTDEGSSSSSNADGTSSSSSSEEEEEEEESSSSGESEESSSSSETSSSESSTSSSDEESSETSSDTSQEAPEGAVSTEEELREAIESAEGEIVLADNITLSAPLNLEKAVSIDGNGHTLVSGFASLDSLITLMPGASGSEFKNITLTVSEGNKHSLNIWKAGDVTLENVTLDHSAAATGAPLVINNAGVTINGKCTVITGENSWYGINLDDRYGETSLTFDLEAEITFSDVYGKDLLWMDESQSQITVNNPEVAGLVYSELRGQYLAPTVLADGNKYATIQEAIAAVESGTITLLQDTIVYSAITIDKDLTIDGAGFTLIGSEKEGSFPVEYRALTSNMMNITNGATVTLRDVQLTAGNLNHDVLYIEQGGTVTLENVSLDHTNAAGGAAMTIESADVTVSGSLNVITGENSECGINVDSATHSQDATLTFADGCDVKHQDASGNEVPLVNLDLAEGQSPESAVVNPGNAGLEFDENGQVVPIPGEEEPEEPETPEAPVATVTVNGVEVGKFDTLQEALNHAPSGATITVTKNGLSAVVSGNRIFTIVLAGEATEYPALRPANGYLLANLGGGQYYVYEAPLIPEIPDTDPLDGWVKRGSRWYLYDNGKKLTGWHKDGNAWYYMDSRGVMLDDGLEVIDGVTYYFYNWGGMANAWWYKDDNGDWFYFRGNGAMAKSSWIEWKGEYYYVGTDGKMLTNTTTPDGYRVDHNGKWLR